MYENEKGQYTEPANVFYNPYTDLCVYREQRNLFRTSEL